MMMIMALIIIIIINIVILKMITALILMIIISIVIITMIIMLIVINIKVCLGFGGSCFIAHTSLPLMDRVLSGRLMMVMMVVMIMMMVMVVIRSISGLFDPPAHPGATHPTRGGERQVIYDIHMKRINYIKVIYDI